MADVKLCFLIDDDQDDREIFCMAMESVAVPATCVTAKDGADALDRLSDEAFNPDLIFLDLNMPRMNGKECLQEIRKIPRLRQTPVIIYSTSILDTDIAESMHLGATSFISKPSNITALTAALDNVLKSVAV